MLLHVDFLWLLPGTQPATAVVAVGAGLAIIAILAGRRLARGPVVAPNAKISDGPLRKEPSVLERAWGHHKSGCNESAIALFTDALALDPCCVEALKGRGLCYAELAQYDCAMQDFHSWVLRDLECGEAYFHRARVWRKLGLNDLAISDFRTSLKYSSSNAAARDAVEELAIVSFEGKPESVPVEVPAKDASLEPAARA